MNNFEDNEARILIMKLEEAISESILLLEIIIDKYGEVKCVKYDKNDDKNIIHDFMFFCLTKTCKSAHVG